MTENKIQAKLKTEDQAKTSLIFFLFTIEIAPNKEDKTIKNTIVFFNCNTTK